MGVVTINSHRKMLELLQDDLVLYYSQNLKQHGEIIALTIPLVKYWANISHPPGIYNMPSSLVN